MNVSDVDEQAAVLAAQVDARLSGEALPEPVVVVAHPVATPAVEVATMDALPLSSYHVMATDERSLMGAQAKMVSWATRQKALCEHELVSEREAHRIAKERGWATARFRANIRTLEQRADFYDKLMLALEAGYVIVPNFEMDVFAIRVLEESNPPRQTLVVNSWHGPAVSAQEREAFRQRPPVLPAGGGKYVNPIPHVYRTQNYAKKPEDQQHWLQSTSGWAQIGFPAALAKPMLMERVADAETGKVFDEIGLAVDAPRREERRGARAGDPILLGRIRNPRKNRPDVTFFIGWYFDPSAL